MQTKDSVLFIGEAMLELVNKDKDLLSKSFAGDVFNTSVYLKRAYPELKAGFMTAVGEDALSNEFVSRVEAENIDTSIIARSKSQHLGTYMVVNDEHGERSFIYWRDSSAAKSMMSSFDEKQRSELAAIASSNSVVFFSGITLAILHPKERELFWQQIDMMKQQGALIVFDPNYRPALWEDEQTAKQQIEKAFTESHWLMPGLDDFKALYGIKTIEACLQFCKQFDYQELVLKQGADSVHVDNQDGHHEFSIVKSSNVVDTTSAGDAFNGIYLGARLCGSSPETATKLANYAASKVIETPGAIMPKALFSKCWSERPSS